MWATVSAGEPHSCTTQPSHYYPRAKFCLLSSITLPTVTFLPSPTQRYLSSIIFSTVTCLPSLSQKLFVFHLSPSFDSSSTTLPTYSHLLSNFQQLLVFHHLYSNHLFFFFHMVLSLLPNSVHSNAANHFLLGHESHTVIKRAPHHKTATLSPVIEGYLIAA